MRVATARPGAKLGGGGSGTVGKDSETVCNGWGAQGAMGGELKAPVSKMTVNTCLGVPTVTLMKYCVISWLWIAILSRA